MRGFIDFHAFRLQNQDIRDDFPSHCFDLRADYIKVVIDHVGAAEAIAISG